MRERRRHDRSRVFSPGTISYGRQRATLDCVVRNMSEGGALLLVDEPRRAPVEMELAVRGGARAARIVWRGETEVGVAFAPPGAGSTVGPASAVVVSLDAVRRERSVPADGQRLADRIARFVCAPRGPDPA